MRKNCYDPQLNYKLSLVFTLLQALELCLINAKVKLFSRVRNEYFLIKREILERHYQNHTKCGKKCVYNLGLLKVLMAI